MTTNAALAFCCDAWWGLILNVRFWGPQGAQISLGPRPPGPLGTAPDFTMYVFVLPFGVINDDDDKTVLWIQQNAQCHYQFV